MFKNLNDKKEVALKEEVANTLDYEIGDELGGFFAYAIPPKIGKVNIASFYSSDIPGSADSILALAIERHKGMYVKVSVYGFKREDGSPFSKVNGKPPLLAQFIGVVEPVEIKLNGNIAKFSGCSVVDNDEIARNLSVTAVKNSLVQVIIQYAGEEPPLNGVNDIETDISLEEEKAKDILTAEEKKTLEKLIKDAKDIEESLKLVNFFGNPKVVYSLYDSGEIKTSDYDKRRENVVGLYNDYVLNTTCPIANCSCKAEVLIDFPDTLLKEQLKPFNRIGLCEQHALDYQEGRLDVENDDYFSFAQKQQNVLLKDFALKRLRIMTTGKSDNYIEYENLIKFSQIRGFLEAIPHSTRLLGEEYLKKKQSR